MTPPPALFETVFEEGRDPLRDELPLQPLRREGGFIYVPQGPGLGIEPDPEQLERFALSV
jgi:D-galactarolactone cycloisomerase